MGVVDGQPVNAAVSNAAWIDANANDATQAELSLHYVNAASSSFIENIQREFNAIATYTGKTINTAYTVTPAWTNNEIGTATDSLFTRVNLITFKFNGTAGHAHSGVDGDGTKVKAFNLDAVPIRGFFQQAADLIGVTGTSFIVTTAMTGKTPSTGSTVLGVVVNTPYNRIQLRYASGLEQNEQIEDTNGNEVFGRLTEAAGVWTLSFFSLISTTETAFNFTGATDLRWYYQELFNPMVNPPTYDPLAFIPSDNITADVVYATGTIAGKVLLSITTPADVAATGAVGVGVSVARADHVHKGVHSLSQTGGTDLFGDVDLTAGHGMTFSTVSQAITLAMNNPKKQTFTLSGTDITNGYVDLSSVAEIDSIFFEFNGVTEREGFDYSVSYTGGAGGNTRVLFSAGGDLVSPATSALVAGDIIWFQYRFGGAL